MKRKFIRKPVTAAQTDFEYALNIQRGNPVEKREDSYYGIAPTDDQIEMGAIQAENVMPGDAIEIDFCADEIDIGTLIDVTDVDIVGNEVIIDALVADYPGSLVSGMRHVGDPVTLHYDATDWVGYTIS